MLLGDRRLEKTDAKQRNKSDNSYTYKAEWEETNFKGLFLEIAAIPKRMQLMHKNSHDQIRTKAIYGEIGVAMTTKYKTTDSWHTSRPKSRKSSSVVVGAVAAVETRENLAAIGKHAAQPAVLKQPTLKMATWPSAQTKPRSARGGCSLTRPENLLHDDDAHNTLAG